MCLFCCRVQRTESKTVHRGNRPRAHREDVAQNSADSGRCALKRFDVRRMIVRFDLVGDRQSVTDIDNAGVLAGTLKDGRPLRRQSAQVDARALVAAVLAPHHAEDAEFGQMSVHVSGCRRFSGIRLRSDSVLALEVRQDTMSFMNSTSPGATSRRSPSIRKSICRPRCPGSLRSNDPGAASCPARCAAFVHDSRDVVQDPFGFASRVIRPSSVDVAENDLVVVFNALQRLASAK